MQHHASCAARCGAGVLLIGAPGSGKSDLLLRLLDHGYTLVADDRVDVDRGVARAPSVLEGLIEVRGLGILRLPFTDSVPLALVVELGSPERLPEPRRHLELPMVMVDPFHCSAPARVTAALRCAMGELSLLAGALV